MLRKIALAFIMLAFFAIAPALAEPDKTYYTEPAILQDDSGLKIHITEVVASDTPIGSYSVTYPSSIYRYYVLYYMTENPTDSPIRWQYDIRFVDSNGTEFTPVDEITGSMIAAGFRSTGPQPIEYAIPRNSTGLYLRWYHIDKTLNEKVWNRLNLTEMTVATPTPAPSVTATPTPAPGPTATPKPAPADGLLPVLAIGIVAGGFVLARITKK